IQMKVMERFRPQSAPLRAIALERNERRSTLIRNRGEVAFAQVAHVSHDFVDIEMPSGGCQERFQERAVTCILRMDFDCGNDVGFHATHNVSLAPCPLDSMVAELVIIPAVESTARK